MPTSDECVVVGSGPGGCVTAYHLAKAGRSVTVLEDGERLSLDAMPAFSRAEMERKYRNGGLTLAFGSARVQYVEGRCVGGGSEVNSGLYHRTPPAVLERWREEYGVERLDSEIDLAEHFEDNERRLSVTKLPSEDLAPPAARLLRLGATRLGWESLEVPRWFKYDGRSVGGGRRQSMTETFVPAMEKAGARLVGNARVTRVERRGARWIVHGVRNDRYREPFEIATNAAFLSAGSIGTPAILQRSHVGTNVGRSLRMHPTVKVVAEFADEMNTPDAGVPSEQVKEWSPEISFGCSISSREHLAVNLYGFRSVLHDLSRRWKRMATYYAMAEGSGTGTVRPLPGFADPLVTYALARSDAAHLKRGLRLLCELLFEAGAVALYPVVTGAPMLRTKDQLASIDDWFAPAAANLMTIHLFSSCPMGERSDRCALDSFGRVRGEFGLHVADGSMLPTSTTVNPQGTIMAIARRNAMEYLR
ncbi:MAG: GMC family oxidoreductase [Candidatus Baltobacteraceae bacterium]